MAEKGVKKKTGVTPLVGLRRRHIHHVGKKVESVPIVAKGVRHV